MIGRTKGIPLAKKYSRPTEEIDCRVHSIYVDAAYYDLKHVYAVGYAVFDPGGALIATGGRCLHSPGTIMAAELEAIYYGIQFGSAGLM